MMIMLIITCYYHYHYDYDYHSGCHYDCIHDSAEHTSNHWQEPLDLSDFFHETIRMVPKPLNHMGMDQNLLLPYVIGLV